MNEEIDKRLAEMATQLAAAEGGTQILLLQTKMAALKAMRD